MLDVFLDCLVNNNLNRLIKSGNPPIHAINEAWECLYTEYIDIAGGTQTRQLMTINADLNAIRCKHEKIRIALIVLANRYSKDMVQVIQNYGYTNKFNWEDPVSYQNDLTSMTGRLSVISLAWQIKEREKEALISELTKDGAKKMTMQDWELHLASLHKFMNGRIDKKTTSVSEYAAAKKLFELNNEAENRELEKMKGMKHGK
jgi:hypothetical protein